MKLLKKLISATAVALSLSLALPLGSFAAQTASAQSSYMVNQNFESNAVGDTIFSGGKAATNSTVSGSSYTSGTISVVADGASNKALKYHKTMSANNVAHYTDLSNGDIKNGTDFVLEFTFWYEGDVSPYDWYGEFVGARKVKDGKANMKSLLIIKDGYLYDGKSANKVTNLVPNLKYKIAIAVHDGNATYDVYLNETKKIANQTYDALESDITGFRALNLTGMKKSNENILQNNVADFPVFYLDDIKLYYSSLPEFAGGVASASPQASTGNNGGTNTGGGNTDGDTDDIGGGAIITPPSTDDKETLVSDATTKGPNLNDLIEDVEDVYNFNFSAPSSSGTTASNLPTSPVSEKSDDIVMIIVFAAASAVIIGGAYLLTKIPKKKQDE